MDNGKMKRVEVEWVDTATHGGWYPVGDFLHTQKVGPLVCKSIGYLMRKDDECVVVVQSVSENDKASDSISIPVKCVVKIRNLQTRAEWNG